LDAESVRAVEAVLTIRSKINLAAEKRQETHFLSNQENEKWMNDYVDRETAAARKRVEDAERAIKQQ